MQRDSLTRADSEYPNNFTFLRFALATGVLLSHSFELLRATDPLSLWLGAGSRLGATAVDGFFLISGSLILGSWTRSRNLASFLNKRCRRIVPGFVVAFLVSVLLVGPLGGNSAYWSELSLAQTLKGLLSLNAPVTPSVFAGQVAPLVNGTMWTIRYEAGCYVALAVLGVAGLATRRRLMLTLAVVAVLGYLLQCPTGVLELGQGGPILQLLVPVPRLLGCFLIGACVHLFAVRFTGPGCLLAIVALLGASRLGFTATQGAILLAGGYLLFALAEFPARVLRAWNGWPDISYGLYLYAWPIQMLLVSWFPSLRPLGLFAVSFALSVLAGIVSWYGVERWFVPPRRSVRPPSETADRVDERAGAPRLSLTT